MPIYEYQCKKCGNAFEALVPNADAKAACDQCGSKQVVKQLSVFSASVATHASAPCSSGGCPTSGMAGTGCSGGGCPFNG